MVFLAKVEIYNSPLERERPKIFLKIGCGKYFSASANNYIIMAELQMGRLDAQVWGGIKSRGFLVLVYF